MRRRYRCPSCHGLFDYDHHPSLESDPLPDDCPYSCGYSQAMPEALMTPHLATNTIVQSVDNVTRGMEEGAEMRAQMAQEHGGLDAAEVSGLKMTDQKDNLRYGDTSYAPVNNPVSQMMTAAPGSVGFSSGGLGYSSTVSQGPYPNAGLRAMLDVQKKFGTMAPSRPALETLQPGYKRRA